MAYVKQQLQNTTKYFNRAQFAWFVDSNTTCISYLAHNKVTFINLPRLRKLQLDVCMLTNINPEFAVS